MIAETMDFEVNSPYKIHGYFFGVYYGRVCYLEACFHCWVVGGTAFITAGTWTVVYCCWVVRLASWFTNQAHRRFLFCTGKRIREESCVVSPPPACTALLGLLGWWIFHLNGCQLHAISLHWEAGEYHFLSSVVE